MKAEVLVNKPTYVLVHGAWGGAWCWEKFTKDLDARNATWRTVNLPSSQLDSDPSSDLTVDADVVARAANAVEGPVILVGHSYAGAVITQAAPLVKRLESLFYIAATVPDIGQSHSDNARLVRVRTEMDAAIHIDGPMLLLDVPAAAIALYQECTLEDREWAASRLTTQTLASFRGPRTAHDVDVLTRYVLCRQDHALDPTLQDLVSQRCDEVISIDADHSPFLSRSEELAEILIG
jgi:pimeloyl-ACP methyl ester carboxylesterase